MLIHKWFDWISSSGPLAPAYRCVSMLALATSFAAGFSHQAAADEVQVLGGGTVLSVGVGASYIDLPETKYSLLTGTSGIDLLGVQTNHDGELWGVRTDVALTARTGQVFGLPALGSLKGFYAYFDDDQRSFCDGNPMGGPRCSWTNIIDDPNINNRLPLASVSDAIYSTSREVIHWGIAGEVILGSGSANSAAAGGIVPKFGLDYRRIDQDTTIRGEATVSNLVMRLNEELDTGYLGLYGGFMGSQVLAPGLTIRLDAQAGVYWARTDYDGRYSNNFSSPTQLSVGALSLTEDRAAAVVAVDADLTQRFDGFTVTLFNKAEWYSYAPEMRYLNNDEATIVVTRPGPIRATRIGDDEAWSYTGGLRVSVPLN